MSILYHGEPFCSRCEGEDWLSPQEAENALEDLGGLFVFLSIHGYTSPIPSIVRLVEHLKAKASVLPPAK